MSLAWHELERAVALLAGGDPYLWGVISFTLQVALLATAAAAFLGLPLALWLGLGRFRGRGTLRALANASLGVPPVAVGFLLFLAFAPRGPLGSLHLNVTRRGVFAAQGLLALPYVVALGAAAIQSLPEELLEQARLLRAGRGQLALLALREARGGLVAALLAALATALSEVAAVTLVGGNVPGYDQTLASAALYGAAAARYDEAVAVGLVLAVVILALMGAASLLQERPRWPRLSSPVVG